MCLRPKTSRHLPTAVPRQRWDTLTPQPLGSLNADSLVVLVVPEGTTLLELRGAALALRLHGRPEAFPELVEAEELIAPFGTSPHVLNSKSSPKPSTPSNRWMPFGWRAALPLKPRAPC